MVLVGSVSAAHWRRVCWAPASVAAMPVALACMPCQSRPSSWWHRAGLRQACRQLRAGWTATLRRLQDMPEGSAHQRASGEWSAVETLRHLVFVHDSWFRRCCLGSTGPFTPIGLCPDYVPGQEEQGLDRAASPSLDEVLAVRDAQAAELERWLSAVTASELSAPAPVPAGPGWPPYARGKSVLECLHVVLNEEWAHPGAQ
jgi:uncharacterized damage-inducible protein DinB